MSEREWRRDAEPADREAFRVADRLQHLTRDEVERVLSRAIELESAGEGERDAWMLDTDALRKVAEELGIAPAHLRSAIEEELLRIEVDVPDWKDRLLVADRIVVQIVVEGDLDTARRTADIWLRQHEGLRKRRDGPTGATWERDPSLVTKVRMKLRLAQGTGALAGANSVVERVRPVDGGRQLVVLEADTSNLRRIAVGLLSGAAALGAGTAVVTGAVDPTGFGLDNVALGAATFAVGGAGVLIGVRMWADRIRRGLERAADAIASPDLVERVESVPRRLRRLFDDWRDVKDDTMRDWRGDRDR